MNGVYLFSQIFIRSFWVFYQQILNKVIKKIYRRIHQMNLWYKWNFE